MKTCHDMLLCHFIYVSGSFGFLFYGEICFAQTKLVAKIIKLRHVEKSIRPVQKLQKLGYCIRNIELALNLLVKC